MDVSVCGRFAYWFADPVRAWYEHHFGPPDPNDLAAQDRYNVAPTDPVVAVVAGVAEAGATDTVAGTKAGSNAGADDADAADAGGRGMVPLEATWGFPAPGGAGRVVVNARAESAATSPLWAPSWGRPGGHCVVPASGFYEWKGSGAARTPFFVHRTDDAPLLLAGLLGGSAARPVVSLLTCAPNRYMAGLHDRMPVVLEPERVGDWLSAGPAEAATLAVPAAEVLDGYAVGREVGDPSAEGPGLVEPVRAWF